MLQWMMDNIFIRTDPAGNIKPDKEKSTEKIDQDGRIEGTIHRYLIVAKK